MGESEQKEKIGWVVLLLLQIAETVACCYLLGKGTADTLRCALWMTLLGGMAMIYLMLGAGRFLQGLVPVIFICVLFSLPCAFFYDRIKPMAAFYLGAVLIAALVERGTGMIFVFYFCAAAVLDHVADVEEAASLLALGVALCLLADFLKKKKSIPEVVLLAEIVTAILYLLRTSMHGRAVSFENLGLELFSTALVLLCAAVLVQLYLWLVKRQGREAAKSAPGQTKKPAAPGLKKAPELSVPIEPVVWVQKKEGGADDSQY